MSITLDNNIEVNYDEDKSYIIETVKSDLYRKNENFNNIISSLQVAPVTPSLYIENGTNNVYAVESYTYSGAANTKDFTRVFPTNTTCDILIVGGGGGGGSGNGGGGGAGQLVLIHQATLNGTYTIKVGKGGRGGWHISKGINSEFGTVIAEGGGANGGTLKDGGSGAGADGYTTDGFNGTAGAGNKNTTIDTFSGATVYSRGNNGGNSFEYMGGGGGGAGEAGGIGGYGTNGGKGGDGLSGISEINYDFKTRFGNYGKLEADGKYYFAGGGGGIAAGTETEIININGGKGGGGSGGGGPESVSSCGLNGLNNTGSGGGGGSGWSGNGGSGGTGIVIIRYLAGITNNLNNSNLSSEVILETSVRMYPPVRTLTSNSLTAVSKVISASCGIQSLFLTNDGKVYSCGRNMYGELGLAINNGTENANPNPAHIKNIRTAIIVAVSCGTEFSLFLTNDGKVYSCGLNQYGQLGQPYNLLTTNSANIQQIIDGGMDSLNIVYIATGNAAAHSMFITHDGKVYSCGYNRSGQLGTTRNNNNVAANSVPTQITATISSLIIVDIKLGGQHSLFLTNNGKVYACGRNQYGQLGTTTNNGNLNANPTPTQITTTIGSLNIVAISAGSHHSLFLTNNGKVYACGLNQYGQLGTTTNNGTTTANPTPTQITTTISSLTIVAIAAGLQHSLFLTNDGKVYACGLNQYGQLGTTTNNGATTANPNPAQIITTIGSLNIVSITSGGNHNIFITDDSKLYACGVNNLGQLGTTTNNGTTTANPTPTIIPFFSTVSNYGSGLYTVSYSSFTASFEPFKCFNDSSVINNEARWRTGDNYLSNGSFNTAVYSTSNLVSGYNGDWLVIKLPVFIKLKRFDIEQIGTALNRAPKDFRFYGSTDGISWSILVDKVGAEYINLYYVHTDMSQYPSNASKYYNYFGLVVSTLLGNETVLSFDELFIYGVELVNTTPFLLASTTKSLTISSLPYIPLTSYNLTFPVATIVDINNVTNNLNNNVILQGEYGINLSTSNITILPKSGQNIPKPTEITNYAIIERMYPPVRNFSAATTTLSGQTYGNGTYIVSYSSTLSSYDPWLCFNTANTAGGHWAHSRYTAGTFNNTSFIVADYLGDWLEIQLPVAIKLTRFSFVTRPTNPDRAPKDFKIYGSNDGITWVELVNKTDAVYDTSTYKQSTPEITRAYSFYALVVNKIFSTGTVLNFDEWYIYGQEVLSSQLSISYNTLTPIKDPIGAQWTYSSSNTNVYHMGSVGIGTTNPSYTLDVRGSIFSSTGGFTQSGLTTWSIASDRRIKENIVKASYEKCLENVKNIELYNFNFKDNYVITNDRHQLGFIAQDVQQVYPKAVEVGKMMKNMEEKIEGLLTLNTTQIDYTLYGAVKGLIQKLENIKIKIERIKSTSNITIQ
jgi:alpha-tubulin suppressor-like RCC1 family protein